MKVFLQHHFYLRFEKVTCLNVLNDVFKFVEFIDLKYKFVILAQNVVASVFYNIISYVFFVVFADKYE